MPLPDGPVFGLPPGADFPGELARGMLARLPDDPVALARVTVIVNTQRMRARFLASLSSSGARLLPRVLLVTDLAPLRQDMPRARVASTLSRQLLLAQAIRALITREPDLAPQSARFALAAGLVTLMDEAAGEGVSFDRILGVDVGAQSAHWQRSLAFLQLVSPLLLGGEPSSATAQARIDIVALSEAWAVNPPADPVILAGSTGSRGLTALLMATVAQLPKGAVVLPGFDFDMPPAVWTRMDDRMVYEDHPQFRFKALLDQLNLSSSDVGPWTATGAHDPRRNAVISLALRPAPVTDQWLSDGKALTDLPGATAGLTLVEAPTPRDESVTVALVMRKAVDEGRSVALVTPDRTLARRVTAMLDRWGIVPDDSAGRPLALSAPGRLLRMTAGLMASRLTTPQLLAVLKHPFVSLLAGRGDHQRMVTLLELHLRRRSIAFPDSAALAVWAVAARDPLASPFADALDRLPAPIVGEASLADLARHHMALVDVLARATGQMWLAEAGTAAAGAMRELADAAPDGGHMTAADYAALISSHLGRQNVTEPVLAHPSVFIWGTIEARVQGVDCLILGALNEGTWPAIATPDHWLNRAMRRDAGLLLPERTIGLAAHDFQQAMGARNVTLTRSRRAGDAETVASRWINRLTGVLAGLPDADGPLALQQMKDRGNDLLALAAQVQAPPARLPPASRPKPAPPAAARPRVMSVTDVVRLITDPYAVYARKILGLSPLAPVLPQADPRSRGTLYHDILNHYARNLTGDADRAALLAAIARDRIATTVAWPLTRVLWQARFMAAIDTILAFDDLHPGTRLLNEDKGDTELWPGGTVLHARPDRIDLMDDGRVHLIDFKSAAPDKTAVKDFQKQLALEAVIAADGGFGPDLAQRAALTSYVGLKAGAATRQENLDLAAIADQRAGVVALLRHYADQASGYTASRIALVTEAGDYDHLARRTEWMLSDTPVLTPVGGDR